MRFIRLHPGAQKGNAANYWSLFEPHYKQNLSANPKRTAKSSFYSSEALRALFVQKSFAILKLFFTALAKELKSPFRYKHRSHRKVAASRDSIVSSEQNWVSVSLPLVNAGKKRNRPRKTARLTPPWVINLVANPRGPP
jgi:hypothetical protein